MIVCNRDLLGYHYLIFLIVLSFFWSQGWRMICPLARVAKGWARG